MKEVRAEVMTATSLRYLGSYRKLVEALFNYEISFFCQGFGTIPHLGVCS